MRKYFFFVSISLLLFSCASGYVNVITGEKYDETKNTTEHFVLPYGSVTMKGKWDKTHYNSISHQQFFKNSDTVEIAVAFNSHKNYEFNRNGALKGNDFVKAFYEWDSKYLVDNYGLDREIIETDTVSHFMLYRIFAKTQSGNFDTYFLLGEKNNNVHNFSISKTEKWTKKEKLSFLKAMFLAEI